MKKILAVVGARPQFIKHAPMEFASEGKCEMITIHTGQHYDYRMSQIFFDELGMSKPRYQLETGGGMHGEMTGKMLQEIEPIIISENPDAVLVYGDTNSTLAGALCAAKLEIPVVHVEAGLRSYNRAMPEEINRVLTDHISSLLVVPTSIAIDNLKQEGISTNIIRAGDVMCDMIRICKERNMLQEKDGGYYYLTLHRPYNTDDPGRLIQIVELLDSLDKPVHFFVHPRTQKKLGELVDTSKFSRIQFKDPLSYFDNIVEMAASSRVITDSGGIQKEAYILKKPCVTIRSETEWKETLHGSWNQLIWDDLNILKEALSVIPNQYQEKLYGDGHAADYILDQIVEFLINIRTR
ncbi:MAG TPA: UDP-N-acetylglucosamine 2-epimerase (non-hydrolyzing) [Saprospiraceae bacterium]|nr:UDP-N-acetylglucosamine 2-epimerase (non-hydrolyzing) [Saprospiraceae bacterium]